jgi:hypothetical protein
MPSKIRYMYLERLFAVMLYVPLLESSWSTDAIQFALALPQ